jgi:hypothetical protein
MISESRGQIPMRGEQRIHILISELQTREQRMVGGGREVARNRLVDARALTREEATSHEKKKVGRVARPSWLDDQSR